jgi:hypothetical protein
LVSGALVTPGALTDKASADLKLERLKFVLSVLGTFGAAIVFVVGLVQYRTAQRWKRVEFVVSEFKSILTQPKVVTALQMVDWAVRSLKLGAADGHDDERRTVVTLKMQCRALMPHTFTGGTTSMVFDAEGDTESHTESHTESEEVDGTLGSMRRFSRDEVLIRDCYDALFDCFSYIGHYLAIGLIGTLELQPYLRYWIDAIAEPTEDPDYALWNVCLFTYIHAYQYDGVTVLFEKYGYDIRPDGELFKSFIAVLGGDTQKLARDLQSVALRSLS